MPMMKKAKPKPGRASSSSQDFTSNGAPRPELIENLDKATASNDSCDALRDEKK